MHDLGYGDGTNRSSSFNQFRSSDVSHSQTIEAGNHYPYYHNPMYNVSNHDDLLSQIQGTLRKSETKRQKSTDLLKSKSSQNSNNAYNRAQKSPGKSPTKPKSVQKQYSMPTHIHGGDYSRQTDMLRSSYTRGGDSTYFGQSDVQQRVSIP